MTQAEPLQQVNLKGRDLLELDDYTTEEIQYLLDLAIELKRKQKKRRGVSAAKRQNDRAYF